MSDSQVNVSSKRFLANADVASTSLGERLALLDLEHSTYFSLNPVAAVVWENVRTPQSRAQLSAIVRDQFDIGDANVDEDIDTLLTDLLRLKLIRTVDA